MSDLTCTVSDSSDRCPRPVGAKGAHGMCPMHYGRWLTTGDPGPVKPLRIRGNLPLLLESKIDKTAGPDACHPWTGRLTDSGYPALIRVNGKSRYPYALVWEQENGPVPPGMQLDHECHNKAVANGFCLPGVCAHRRCCNERHIKAKTPKNHKADSPQYPRARGSAAGNAVLTVEMVRQIRISLTDREKHRVIAARFGISRATVSAINQRRLWGWLD